MSWRRSLQYGGSSALLVVLLAGVLVFANLISNNHYRRVDTTAAGLYTLSPQTVKVLGELTEPVHATAFFEPDTPAQREATQLFEQCRAVTRQFDYRFVDPDKHPAEAQRHKITQYNTILLTQGEREVRITAFTESEITSGLIRVTRETRRQIRFTSGHGERPLRGFDRDGLDSVARALEGQGFETSELLLLEAGAVPTDTDVLVVAGPRKPLLPEEIAALADYLDRGGNVVILADPDSTSDLAALLEPWGIATPEKVIIDPTSRMFGGDFTVPLVSQYPPHEITEGFNLAAFFPVARPIEEEKRAGVTQTVIARTGPDAWGESDIKSSEVAFDDGDSQGPVAVMVLAERRGEDAVTEPEEGSAADVADHETGSAETTSSPAGQGGRLLVAGDADFPTNQWFGFSGNGDLFLNAVTWLAKEEGLVSIRAKEHTPQTLALTPIQGATLFYVFVAGMPLVALTGAFGVWRWRRAL
ncbi:MAG TPA: Gldg family protein [bacterium]